MEEKQREQKRARTVRTDYLADVEELQAWVARAELQVQDRSVEPLKLREHLRQIQTELGPIADKLERLTKNGRTIVDNTNDQGEKELIEKTILNLTEQIGQVRAWLEEKKQQVGDSLDAWQRFLVLYESVTAWTLEKRNFLKEPLKLSTLVQTRQRLHDYSTAVKSCKQVNKNLSEMGKELELIGQITSVGDLPEKLASAEEAKVEVEGHLLETNALLQEASEEWEQCEKKFKDVKSFLEKARQSLDSAQNKKKPLRDQHALREKMTSDIAIQKTKISISVEKLQVHFRSGISGDNKISETAAEMTAELTSLNDVVKEQTAQLEACLSQIDQYQQEIQQLRQQIVQVEQQLRAAMSPTYLPNDREKAVQEQQTLQVQMDEWRLQTRLLTDNILALDPYYMPPPVDHQRATGLASYAEIVAGRSTPVSRNASPLRTVVESLPVPQPRAVSSEEPKIKTPKPRRGRSPTRKVKKPSEVEKPIQAVFQQVPAQSNLTLPMELRQNRSPSPVWVPGSTSYADMVRKARQEAERVAQAHEMVRLSKEHESNCALTSREPSLRPPEVEEKTNQAYRGMEQPAMLKESWADEPIDYEMMEKFENEAAPTSEMYSYMHPMPELVQFIGTGLASYPVGGFVFQNAPGHLGAPLTAYEHFVTHENYEIYSGTNVAPLSTEALHQEPIAEVISRSEPKEIQAEPPPAVVDISSRNDVAHSPKNQASPGEAATQVQGISYAKILSQGLPERPISPVFLPQRSQSPHETTPPEAKLEQRPVEPVEEKRERDWDTIKKNPRKKMQDKKEANAARKEPQDREKNRKSKIEKFIKEEKEIVVPNVVVVDEDAAEEKLSKSSQEKKRKQKKKPAKSVDDEIDKALKEIADMEKQKKLPKVREYTLQHDDVDKVKLDRGKRAKVSEEKRETKGSSKREDMSKPEVKKPEVKEVKVGGKGKGKNRSEGVDITIESDTRGAEVECVEKVKEKSLDDSPRSSKKREEKSKKTEKKLDKENSNPDVVKVQKIKASSGDNINLKKDIKTRDVEQKESLEDLKIEQNEEIVEKLSKTCKDTRPGRQENGKQVRGKNLSKPADNPKLIPVETPVATADAQKSEQLSDKLEKSEGEIKSSSTKNVDKETTAKLIKEEKSIQTKNITETVKGKPEKKTNKKSKETTPTDKITIKETISMNATNVKGLKISCKAQKSEQDKLEIVEAKETLPQTQSDSKLKKKSKLKSTASTKISIPPTIVSESRADSQLILTEERVSSRVKQLVTLRPASVEANLINTYAVISTPKPLQVETVTEKSSIDTTKTATLALIKAERVSCKEETTSNRIITVKIPTEAPLFGSVQDRKKSRSISAAGAEPEVTKDPQQVKTDAKKVEIHEEIEKPSAKTTEKKEISPVLLAQDLVQPYWLDAHRYYDAESNFHQNYKVVKVIKEPQPPPPPSVPISKSSSIERIVQESKMSTTDLEDEKASKTIQATESLLLSESFKGLTEHSAPSVETVLPLKVPKTPTPAVVNDKAPQKSSETVKKPSEEVEKITKPSVRVVVGILDESMVKTDLKTDEKILKISENVETRVENAEKLPKKTEETPNQVQKTDKKPNQKPPEKSTLTTVKAEKSVIELNSELNSLEKSPLSTEETLQKPKPIHLVSSDAWMSILDEPMTLDDDFDDDDDDDKVPESNLKTLKNDATESSITQVIKPDEIVIETSSETFAVSLQKPVEKKSPPTVSKAPEESEPSAAAATSQVPHRKKSKEKSQTSREEPLATSSPSDLKNNNKSVVETAQAFSTTDEMMKFKSIEMDARVVKELKEPFTKVSSGIIDSNSWATVVEKSESSEISEQVDPAIITSKHTQVQIVVQEAVEPVRVDNQGFMEVVNRKEELPSRQSKSRSSSAQRDNSQADGKVVQPSAVAIKRENESRDSSALEDSPANVESDATSEINVSERKVESKKLGKSKKQVTTNLSSEKVSQVQEIKKAPTIDIEPPEIDNTATSKNKSKQKKKQKGKEAELEKVSLTKDSITTTPSTDSSKPDKKSFKTDDSKDDTTKTEIDGGIKSKAIEKIETQNDKIALEATTTIEIATKVKSKHKTEEIQVEPAEILEKIETKLSTTSESPTKIPVNKKKTKVVQKSDQAPAKDTQSIEKPEKIKQQDQLLEKEEEKSIKSTPDSLETKIKDGKNASPSSKPLENPKEAPKQSTSVAKAKEKSSEIASESAKSEKLSKNTLKKDTEKKLFPEKVDESKSKGQHLKHTQTLTVESEKSSGKTSSKGSDDQIPPSNVSEITVDSKDKAPEVSKTLDSSVSPEKPSSKDAAKKLAPTKAPKQSDITVDTLTALKNKEKPLEPIPETPKQATSSTTVDTEKSKPKTVETCAKNAKKKSKSLETSKKPINIDEQQQPKSASVEKVKEKPSESLKQSNMMLESAKMIEMEATNIIVEPEVQKKVDKSVKDGKKKSPAAAADKQQTAEPVEKLEKEPVEPALNTFEKLDSTLVPEKPSNKAGKLLKTGKKSHEKLKNVAEDQATPKTTEEKPQKSSLGVPKKLATPENTWSKSDQISAETVEKPINTVENAPPPPPAAIEVAKKPEEKETKTGATVAENPEATSQPEKPLTKTATLSRYPTKKSSKKSKNIVENKSPSQTEKKIEKLPEPSKKLDGIDESSRMILAESTRESVEKGPRTEVKLIQSQTPKSEEIQPQLPPKEIEKPLESSEKPDGVEESTRIILLESTVIEQKVLKQQPTLAESLKPKVTLPPTINDKDSDFCVVPNQASEPAQETLLLLLQDMVIVDAASEPRPRPLTKAKAIADLASQAGATQVEICETPTAKVQFYIDEDDIVVVSHAPDASTPPPSSSPLCSSLATSQDNMSMDSFWPEKLEYHDAERQYFEQLSKRKQKKSPREEIKDLQKTFNLFEESLNNFPQKDLSTMQANFTSIQINLTQYDSRVVELAEKLEKMDTKDTSTLTATLATLCSRVAQLLEQVQTGLEAIKLAQDLQQQQQQREISMYMTFLEETDIWLKTLITTINQEDHSFDSFKMLEDKLDDRTRRVAQLEHLPDVGPLARSLKEALLETSSRLRQKQQELEDDGSARASDDLGRDDDATLNQAPSIHSGEEISWADVSLQTGQSLLLAEQKPAQLTKQTSISPPQSLEPVETHSMPVQVSLCDPQRPPQETIKILKTANDTHDMIEIATKNILPSTAQFLAQERAMEDIVVDMKYQDAQQAAKSELNIQLAAPHQTFETILVEPDDVTTKVVIDADGTKRIIVRKLRKTIVTSTHQDIASSSQIPYPVKTFAEASLRDQQVTITRTRSDRGVEMSTAQVYGGCSVATTTGPIPGSEIDMGEVEGGTFKIEGSGYHTETSTVHATVQQVTRRVIRKTQRTIKRVTIINGKETVSEEVVEEPDEIEIDDQSIPQISINVVKREEHSGGQLEVSAGEIISTFAKKLTPETSEINDIKEVSALKHEEKYEKDGEKISDLPAPIKLEQKVIFANFPPTKVEKTDKDTCKSTDAPVTSKAIVESGTLEIKQHNGSSTVVELADKPILVLENEKSPETTADKVIGDIVEIVSIEKAPDTAERPSASVETLAVKPENEDEIVKEKLDMKLPVEKESEIVDALPTHPKQPAERPAESQVILIKEPKHTPEMSQKSEAYIEPEKSDDDSADSRKSKKKKRRKDLEAFENLIAAESNSSIATTIAESMEINLPSESPKQMSEQPQPDVIMDVSLSSANEETINSGYEAEEQATLKDSKKRKKQRKKRQKVKISDTEQVTEVPKSTTDEAAFSDETRPPQPDKQLKTIVKKNGRHQKKRKEKLQKASETSQTSPDKVETPTTSKLLEVPETAIQGVEIGQQTSPEPPAKVVQKQGVETAHEMQTSPTPLLDSGIQTTTVKSPDLEHSSMQTEALEPVETEEINVQATTDVNSSAMQTTPVETAVLSEIATQTLMIQEFLDAKQQTTPPPQIQEISKQESTVQTSPEAIATAEIDIQTSAPASPPEVPTQNFQVQVDLEAIPPPVAVMETQTTQVAIEEIALQTEIPTIESVAQTSPEPEELQQQAGIDLSAQTSMESLKITTDKEAQTISPAPVVIPPTAETFVQLDRKELIPMCEESTLTIPETLLLLDTCSQTLQEEKHAVKVTVTSTSQQITVESSDVSTMPEGDCTQDTATSPVPIVETVDTETEQIVVQDTANASTEPIPHETKDTATSPIDEFIQREASHDRALDKAAVIEPVAPESPAKIVDVVGIAESPVELPPSPFVVTAAEVETAEKIEAVKEEIEEVEKVKQLEEVKKIDEAEKKIPEKVKEILQKSTCEKPETEKDYSLEIHVQATIEMSDSTTTTPESSVVATSEEPGETAANPSTDNKSRRRPKKKQKPKTPKSRESSPARRVFSFAPPRTGSREHPEVVSSSRPTYSEVSKRDLKNRAGSVDEPADSSNLVGLVDKLKTSTVKKLELNGQEVSLQVTMEQSDEENRPQVHNTLDEVSDLEPEPMDTSEEIFSPTEELIPTNPIRPEQKSRVLEAACESSSVMMDVKKTQTLAQTTLLASRMMLDRLKNLQNAKETTYLSKIIHMSTLDSPAAATSVEKCNAEVLQTELSHLRSAIEQQNNVVAEQTLITIVKTISTWIETIEYRILYYGPTYCSDSLLDLAKLRDEMSHVKENINELGKLWQRVEPHYPPQECDMIRECMDTLAIQVQAIEDVASAEERQSIQDLTRWQQFIHGIDNIYRLVQEHCSQLDSILESEQSTIWKLKELEKLENTNRIHMCKTKKLLASAKALLRDEHPVLHRVIPEQVYLADDTTQTIEHNICMERERLLQQLALAKEYEQTLLEFAQITDIAEELLASAIAVMSLEHLQEEMQKHRKFFVNLNHCRAILESLGDNLDLETRTKHAALHEELHSKANSLLDAAAIRAQKMSLAASRWMLLEQGIKEERGWLQVAHQRVPNLHAVTSTDYNQYVSLYEALSSDIGSHHARLVQLLSVANSLHELITIEDPEDRYGEALEVITRLRSNVESSLMRLLNFRACWISRDLAHNRLEMWMATAERELASLKDNWAGRMSRFWELKAQYELHNNIRGDANASFEQALRILPLSDEMLQRQFQGDFEDRWQSVASQIHAIQEAVANKISSEDISADEKLQLLEAELRELHTTIDGFHGVLKTAEELELYVKQSTVLYERVCEIQDKLGRVGMLPAAESERVGLLLSLARRIESQIGEEQDLAHLLHERLQYLLQGIARVRRAHVKEAQVLDQCEACDKKGSDEVASAVSRCQTVSQELSNVWRDLMGLRQVLHTLPGGMRVSVSPVGIERDISSLQDTNAALESRASRLFSHLRTRLNLWRRFEHQLELVQQSVQEADYMVELLSVQGTVDYERLVKATERLESLNGDLGAQEVCLIGELREAAEHLRDLCTPEVSERVDAAVSEAVQAWDDTRAQLDALCTKYQRAAKLWEQYREAVDTVTSWVNTQMGDISNLSPEEGQQKVKVCEETLAEHKERLAELRDLVAQIASDVGLESDGPLHFEVEALGRRLEDVRETLSTLADTADARAVNQELARNDLCQTKNFLDSVQQSLSTVGQGESKEQLKLLQSHLLALTRTEPQLQSLKDRALEIVKDTTVIEVLQLWQRVFRETFQQYHRLSARLVRSQDVSAALRLWQEYLANVQEFLANNLPGDYSGLSEHRNLCQVHRNLLTNQQHLILSIRADKRRDLSVAEQFNALTNLHNETLSKIMERHAAVRDRLSAWDRYKHNQTQLLSWLKDIERDKSKLHLRFIHLRRLDKLIARIEQLLEKIPAGEAQLDGLFEQQETLLASAEEALAVSVRMEHAANVQRVANARASLETWRDFVLRIRKLSASHSNQSSSVANTFAEISAALSTAFHTPTGRKQDIQQQLDSLQELKIRLTDTTTAELEALGVTTEQLRECLSPSDMKNLNQQCSLLWQQHGDLEHQLALLAYRLSERLSLRGKWDKRHARLLVWITDAEARVSADKSVEEPEEALKRLEGELHAEMALKQHDLDWIVTTAGELMMNFGDDERIQEALIELNERWTRLANASKARAGKLVDLMQTMTSLERRIAEIRAWLGKVELQLTEPLILESKTQVALDQQLANHETLQKAIEAESGNIGEILNLCEILVSDCNAWRASFNTDALKAGMQGLEKRWKTTCVRSAERKRKILTAWKLIQDLDKIAREQEHWVEKTERKLEPHANPEKPSKQESQTAATQVRNILQDIEAHSPALLILEQSYSRLVKGGLEPENVRQLMDNVRKLIQRWSALKPAATAILAALSHEHAAYREFVTAHGSAVIALTQIDVNLTQIQHLSTSASPRRQLQQLAELEQELAVQNATLARADKLALSVMQGSHAANVHVIQELVDEYQLLWQDIKLRVTTLRTKLEDRRKVDEAVQVETLKFEQDSAVQVDTLPKLVRMTSCDAYLMELQSALAECRDAVAELEEAIAPEPIAGPELAAASKNIARLIGSCSSAMELARHLHALLIQDGKLMSTESVDMDMLGARYDAVLSRARAREQQIREIRSPLIDAYTLSCKHDGGRLTCPLCSQKNWAQLDIDLWRLEKWLDYAEATQSGQHSPPREIEELEEVIQDHREFLLNSDSHKSIVVSLNIVGTHLADHTEDTERAQDLRDRLAKANARWDCVCQTAQSWQASLQSSLLGNQQFHAIVDELLNWLERTESSIRASEPIDLTEDSSVIRAKYNKFKELRCDLEKCEPRVLSLQEAANQLLDQKLEIRSRVQELRLRLQSLRRLTGIYALKLGAALGLDPKEVGLVATTSSLASLSQDLLDGSTSGASQNDNASAIDGDERDRTVLVRGYRFIGRVIRASLPIQALMLLLLGVASLVPSAEDDYSCMLSNNLARAFNPVVNYPNGPPPL